MKAGFSNPDFRIALLRQGSRCGQREWRGIRALNIEVQLMRSWGTLHIAIRVGIGADRLKLTG